MTKWAILLFLVFLSCGVYAKDLQFVSGNHPPLSGEHLLGKGTLTVEIERIFRQEGYSIDFSFTPWNRGYKETLHGRFDATYPYSWSKERAESFLYSNVISSDNVYIYKLKSNNLSLDHPTSINVTYCHPEGYTLLKEEIHYISKNSIQLITAKSLRECINLVLRGKADIFSSTDSVAKHLLGPSYEFTAASNNSLLEVKKYLIAPIGEENSKKIISIVNKHFK